MRFDNIAGHEEAKTLLRDMQQRECVPHALLFTGTDDSGAWTLAWAFAAYLNCLSPIAQGEPCGHCTSCVKYRVLAHPDLFCLFPVFGGEKVISDDFLPQWREMVASQPYFTHKDWLEKIKAGNSRPIIYTKENDLLDERMGYRISEAKYRVLMIWQPERMHIHLSNKLLKLIEEPPPRTLILMVSINPRQLLPTILSRTQRIDLKRLDTETLYHSLKVSKTYASRSEEEVRRASHLAQGSYRHAESILSRKNKVNTYLTIFEQFLSAATHTAELNRMKKLSETVAALGREEQIAFLTYVGNLFRECYIYNLATPQLSYLQPEEEAIVARLNGVITRTTIRTLHKEVESAIRDIGQNANSKIVVFDLLLRLTAAISPIMKAKGIAF